MYIIVGLGNPTSQYARTRHNVGFDAVDVLAERYGISVDTKKYKALYGKGVIEGQKVILAKPQTYMNASGESVRELIDYFKIDETEELIVMYDDISLEPGQIRLRGKGSAGGHNGIKIGVGEKPAGWDLADHVLGRFSKEDREAVDEALKRAKDAVVMMMTQGMDAAMNEYNRKV